MIIIFLPLNIYLRLDFHINIIIFLNCLNNLNYHIINIIIGRYLSCVIYIFFLQNYKMDVFVNSLVSYVKLFAVNSCE